MQPLFATLYGYLFLKQHEKITLHVVLEAVIVVTVIALISAFQHRIPKTFKRR